ncbi:uncharacterized protein LOC124434094 [Xenia sp. Carnegie-2017]|uniref:uncharacterized protein LOC124434094 n=2 Tax=Xenia sp. Carnegie-2017 TaxID=2897299 RepID=UPI001F044B85|nr:uncharacterized protein LOC124434094 [Xenia sp. Carnegie-2017]
MELEGLKRSFKLIQSHNLQVSKKVMAAGKKSGCRLLLDWAQSISNHVYWCAASSGGDEKLLKAKWLSLLNHICNIHDGHSELFPKCEHGTLEPRLWIKKGSRAFTELASIVESRYLMKDIGKLSHEKQTSALEGFHRVVILYAPKHTHFFYKAMQAR